MMLKNNLADRILGDWPEHELERVPNCPVCGSYERNQMYEGLTDRVFGCAPGKWKLLQCLECDSAYLDPRPTYESIGLAYQEYFTHSDITEPQAINPENKWASFRHSLRNGYLNARYNAKLTPAHPAGRLLLPMIPPLRERADRWIRHLPPAISGAKLLEIGCGNGSFLRIMRQLGWEVQGLEPDTKAARIAQMNGIPVIDGLLFPETFPAESFDAISLHHVIEHLHSPIEVLETCYRILRPGGIISVITPNLASRGSRIYKKDWYPLDPPRHLVIFTTFALEQAMRKVGYKNITAHASFFGAASLFRESEKLRSDDKNVMLSPVKSKFRIGERIANLMAYVNPHDSEEAVVTGIKDC